VALRDTPPRFTKDMGDMTRFRRLVASVALIAALPMALAQTYPDHVIKLILPFPPGSATDGVARVVADELRKSLGQNVIIENLAGADGIIAAQAVKRAAPDGYTLMVSTNSAHGSNPALYNTLPYDPEKDFEPVGGLIRIPQLLVVRKDFPADDVAGLIRLAQERSAARPLSFGTGNTSSRVAAELLKASGKIDLAGVPYRGMPQVLTDLVGGQIDICFSDPFAAAGFIDSGQVKVLAVADSTRLQLLPNVPTMAEAGHKSVAVISFAAVFAPAKTDPAIVDRLNRAINKILVTNQTREFIHKMGATPMVMTPGELRSFVSGEIALWGRLVEMAGIAKK
jgi:tripartite-type tricarboxylate transporter receptor subunit TctC